MEHWRRASFSFFTGLFFEGVLQIEPDGLEVRIHRKDPFSKEQIIRCQVTSIFL